MSIRTKTMLLTVCAVIISMAVSMSIGVASIKQVGNESADRILNLLCEAGEKNLDTYFSGVETSVGMVSAFVRADLQATADADMERHTEKVREVFGDVAHRTQGVLTYYYRIDPSVSDEQAGFWYVRTGAGFGVHEVTDITQYDTEDTSALVWYTNPKKTGKPLWLPPYITDNYGARVISYNEPIFVGDRFIGVVGMEIEYTMMAEQVNSIRLMENGYAFLNDADGNLIYHPYVDVVGTPQEELPKNPAGLIGRGANVRYTYEGVEKRAARQPLKNGMWLTVSVPVSEISNIWERLVRELTVVSVVSNPSRR